MSPTEQARGDSGKERKLHRWQNGEKTLGETRLSRGASSPPARRISSLFQLQQSQSVSGPLVPGVFTHTHVHTHTHTHTHTDSVTQRWLFLNTLQSRTFTPRLEMLTFDCKHLPQQTANLTLICFKLQWIKGKLIISRRTFNGLSQKAFYCMMGQICRWVFFRSQWGIAKPWNKKNTRFLMWW